MGIKTGETIRNPETEEISTSWENADGVLEPDNGDTGKSGDAENSRNPGCLLGLLPKPIQAAFLKHIPEPPGDAGTGMFEIQPFTRKSK